MQNSILLPRGQPVIARYEGSTPMENDSGRDLAARHGTILEFLRYACGTNREPRRRSRLEMIFRERLANRIKKIGYVNA